MADDKFDAIVVGAGPAGSACAYALAKAGKSVLLLERGNTAGSKNVSGGRLYTYALELLEPDMFKRAPDAERNAAAIRVHERAARELLSLDKFSLHEGNPHILLDRAICAKCSPKVCLIVCPARCYRLKDEQVNFEYAGCLECGTCRVMCKDKGITSWNYPGATYGITFRCS